MTIPLPSLGDEHLVLRPYELADFDEFTELVARPDLTTHIGGPMTIQESGQLFHAMTKAYYGSNIEAWAVVLADSEEYIGHAMLRRRLPEDDPQLSFVLHERFWARGLGTRVVTEMLGYAFDVSRHQRVTSSIAADHIRASRVLERCGMRLDQPKNGQAGEQAVYSMTREVWQAAMTEKQSTE